MALAMASEIPVASADAPSPRPNSPSDCCCIRLWVILAVGPGIERSVGTGEIREASWHIFSVVNVVGERTSCWA